MDEEIANGIIKISGDKENPIKTMLDMVNSIVIDPSKAQVTRLLTLYQAVMGCCIKSGDFLSFF